LAPVSASSAPFANVKCINAAVADHGKRVQVRFCDGSMFEFHGLWLRDACRDSNVVSAAAGERYLSRIVFETGGDGSVAEAQLVDEGLKVSWAMEGEEMKTVHSIFSSEFLRLYAPVAGKHLEGATDHPSKESFKWLEPYTGFQHAPAPSMDLKKLWKNKNLPDQFQHRDTTSCMSDPEANLELLQCLMKHGVVILDDVPPAPDASVLLKFAYDCLGGMQKDPARDEPNWVIQKKDAAQSVSYAQEKRLNNHTDQSVPAHGIPALLLVVNYIEGTGVNTLVDGYAVAEALRERDPDAFRLLSTYSNSQERDFVRSRVDSVQEGTQSLLIQTKQPIIQTNIDGEIIRLQYNEVFRTPSTIPFDKFEDWYRAYLKFNDMIHGEEFQVEVPVGKGQMLLLDNWRVLHGRAGGKSSPSRKIMGGTVVREAFHSKATQLMGAHYPLPDKSAGR